MKDLQTLLKDRDVQLAFDEVQQTQAAYWRALGQLEVFIGQEIDGQDDFNDMTLEAVIEKTLESGSGAV